MDKKGDTKMVSEVEEQLEFNFMQKETNPIIKVEKQERYYEYMKRRYREAEEQDRLNEN